ncbi:protein of unknown function DUF477 [Thalassoporum mexicanum PCC 7367]|uniref:photosystem II repair protein Psb32 n=1 Tax=Thalassoporum mexicanum TaxID=3457544 RepID=UPI00029FD736|nr:TPM domain-containing protein [Pseudanabaena sp. PCC 7367]AFY69753.1 protein of unknown function DUF477 [Pseudanabaena sp. PCC 7367]
MKYLPLLSLRQLPIVLKSWGLGAIAILLALLVFVTPAIAATVDDVPSLLEGDRTWVIDFADVISPSIENGVYSDLEQLNQQTGLEVRFVTIDRIDYGQPTDEFAQQVFDKWFPTDDEKANQALILLATEDYRSAIVTGAEVEAIMPESIAQSIANTNVLYPAQKKQFNQALSDGSDRLVAVLSGQPDPGEPVVQEKTFAASTYATAEETDTQSSTVLVVVLLVVATVLPMVAYFMLT